MRRLLPFLFLLALAAPVLAEPRHGIAMHGHPALPANYQHFPYVKPDVKKGGSVRYGVVGTFDSLNPFILKSMRTTARGVWDPQFGHLLYEPLMQRSADEPFSLYGLLAQTVEMDEERTFIQFNLNPAAKWSDGMPVTPEDVIFTFELLRDKGRTPFSNRLTPVARMEKVGERSVKFTFNEKSDREFPLILATATPILPKHAVDPDTFDQSSLQIPVGSGPYTVKSLRPGERITFERNPDYWGKDVPAKVGFDNYDQISVEYFLQENTLFEAFKKGVVDIYPEGSPVHWARAYDFPDVQNGAVIKDAFQPELPTGMLGFVFTRAGRCSRTGMSVRVWRWRSTSNGQTGTSSRARIRARRASGRTRPSPRLAQLPTPGSLPFSATQRTISIHRSWMAPIGCPIRMPPAATEMCCAGLSTSSRRAATRSRTARWRASPAIRCGSRS